MALPIEITPAPLIPVGAVELWRGCESGGSGDEDVDSAAAIAASPGLDSSHIWAVLLSGVVFGAMALPIEITPAPLIPVGAVELWRGCESGGSGDEDVDSAAAIAASPGLDSSHIWAVLLSGVVFGAMVLPIEINSAPLIPVGAVEPQRGCEGGGSNDEPLGNATA